MRSVPKLFDYVRSHLGDEIELLHDIHERLTPIQTVGLAKQLEPYQLSSWKMAWHRSRWSGSASGAARARPRSPWVSCSTIRMNGSSWSVNS